ncbi:hypothetical protein B0T24DRAFT_669926 [Lasiosphaeria ovina]|uniref:Uncharacterized protein n=1 Tax=Lasiosphaeria ovina TaxID=92902 RepID=A0AAE0JXF0_9PEZI|nr:hypothetical protein B0T24DRAFT_669926 [Lasiosphaeria ovina]
MSGDLDPAILAAMMDDLGVDRVNNLPLEDNHRNHEFANHHNPASRNLNLERLNRSIQQIDPTLDNVWQSSIRNGVFQDEDAEAVAALADLGGGRIYQATRSMIQSMNDPRRHGSNPRDSLHQQSRNNLSDRNMPVGNGPVSIQNQVRDLAAANSGRIPTGPRNGPGNHTSGGSNSRNGAGSNRGAPSANNRRGGGNDVSTARNNPNGPGGNRGVSAVNDRNVHRGNNNNAPPNAPRGPRRQQGSTGPISSRTRSAVNNNSGPQQNIAPPRAPEFLVNSLPARPSAPHATGTHALPAQAPPHAPNTQNAPAGTTIPVIQINNTPSQYEAGPADINNEPKNIVLKLPVIYQPNTWADNSALNCVAYLTTEGPPNNGFFILQFEGVTIARWPVTRWHNFTSENAQIIAVFHNDDNLGVPYLLQFRTGEDLMNFISTIRGLRDGILDAVNVQVTSSATQDAVDEHFVSATARDFVDVQVASSATRGVVDARSVQEPAFEEPATVAQVPEESVVEDFDKIAGTGIQADDGSTGANVLNGSDNQAETLAADSSSANEVAQSEAANPSPSGTDERIMQMRKLARAFFKVFAVQGISGKTMEEVATTVQAIKDAIYDHLREDCGDPNSYIDEVLDELFEEAFGKPQQPKPAAISSVEVDTVPIPNGNGRIQYTRDELLLLRSFAISPPEALAEVNIPINPHPQVYRPSTTAVSSTLPGQSDTRSISPSQIGQSTDAMNWVLGVSASPPAASAGIQGIVNNNNTPTVNVEPTPPNVGLQQSLWATPNIEFRSPNAFTGPMYERHRWPTNSYIYDLAQLDPSATPDQVAAVLLPLEGHTPQVAGGAPRLATPDNIRELESRMSRLSIEDPFQPLINIHQHATTEITQTTTAQRQVAGPPIRAAEPILSPVLAANVGFQGIAARPGHRGLGDSRHNMDEALPVQNATNIPGIQVGLQGAGAREQPQQATNPERTRNAFQGITAQAGHRGLGASRHNI